MLITRRSPFTGKVNTREINCTISQLIAWEKLRVNIQDAMPNLSADDREFILTGITPDEWPGVEAANQA